MSTLTLTLRLVLSMTVVIGVMWLAARMLRGRGGIPARRPGQPDAIEILGRRAFSKGASVAVVRTGGRLLVLGITETQVNLLAETDEAAEADLTIGEDGRTPALGPARPSLTRRLSLESLREHTVRRL